MNEQYIQMADELLAQNLNREMPIEDLHKMIINDVAGAFGDDEQVAMAVAEYLKKKDPQQQDGESGLELGQPSSDSAGVPELGSKMPNKGGLEGADLFDEESVVPDARQKGTEQFLSQRQEDIDELKKEADKRFADLQEAIMNAQTPEDIEVAFAGAGLSSEDFKDFMGEVREANPYYVRSLEAEAEYRKTFGAPASGDYDLLDVWEGVDAEIYRLEAERDKTRAEWNRLRWDEGNSAESLKFVGDQISNLTRRIGDEYGKWDKVSDLMVKESESDKEKIKEKLSPEAYGIYEAYDNAYSTAIVENLAVLINDANIDQDPMSVLQYYMGQMARGTMDLQQVLDEILGTTGATGDGRDPNFASKELRKIASDAASKAAKEKFRNTESDSEFFARRIEREFRDNKLLSVDFDGDGYVAPMGFYESYLSKFKIGPSITLGALFSGIYSDDEIESKWENVRKLYEPLERAVVSTVHMGGDIGATGNHLVQGIANLFGADTEYADEISDMVGEWKKSYQERGTEFVPINEFGRMGGEATLNQAAYSVPFSLIQIVGRSHPLVGAMLMMGVGHDVYLRYKDEEWWNDMSDLGKATLIGGMTGTEFGTEWLGNKLLLGGGKFIGTGLRTATTPLGRAATTLGGFTAGASMETGTELLNLFAQNGIHNFMLTPYGVQAKPIFDTTEMINTAQVAVLMSGGIQAPVAGYTYAQQSSAIRSIRQEIDLDIKELRDPNVSEEVAMEALKRLMANQSKLVGKYTDMAEYAQWMSENKESDFAAMNHYNAKAREIIGKLKEGNLTRAQEARLRSELATALHGEYQHSFVGLQEYLIETAPKTGMDRLKNRINSHRTEIDELRSKRGELKLEEADGKDVKGELALVEDQISKMSGALTAMEDALTKAEKAEVAGDEKAKVEALQEAGTYVRKSEALERVKRLASTSGIELNQADLENMRELHVTNSHAYMLDENGHVISAFEHAKPKGKTDHPPTARVKDEDVLKMEELGYSAIGTQDGMTAMVYDPDGAMQKLFPGMKTQENLEDSLRIARNAYLVTGQVTSKGQKSIKIDAMASAITQGMDMTVLSDDLTKFYQDNKARIDERAAQIASNKENRSAEDLKDPGEPGGSTLKSSRAEAVRNMAEKMGLTVKVGTDAQVFAASGRGSKAYLDGVIVGGYHVNGTNEIVLSENATAKDVLEELVHAKINNQILSDSKRAERFEHDLQAIMSSDPYLRALLEVKKRDYTTLFEGQGYKGDQLDKMVQNELLAEAVSQYVSDSDAFDPSTISSLISYVRGFLPEGWNKGLEIDVTKDNLDAIMAKLDAGLRSGRAINVVENPDQKREETDDPTLFSQYSGKNSFLHNRPVTIQVIKHGGRESYVMRPIEKTFSDYNHFRSWFNKLSGNGNVTSDIEFRISYTDENGNVKNLNTPKPFPGREKSYPIESWASRYQKSQMSYDRADKMAQERYSELEDLKSMLVSAGMKEEQALDLLNWNGRGVGWNVGFPTAQEMANNRQAVGDFLAESEQTSPESVVQFAQYNDIVDAMNEVLSTIDGKPVLEIKKYRVDEEYRQNVNTALLALTEDEKAVQDFAKSLLNVNRPLSNAEIQNFLTAVSDKLHGTKGNRSGTSKAHQDRVVEALEVPMTRLMNTDRGQDFINFFSDFREGIPSHMEEVASANGLDINDLMEDTDLYIGMVAILSNGNEALHNINLADGVYAAWASGDKARLELALQQIGNVGYYPGIPGRPEKQRTQAHREGIERLIELYGDGSEPLLSKLQRTHPTKRGPSKRDVMAEKEYWCMTEKKLGGFGPKIGAFMCNLLGDLSVMAMDSHHMAEINRARGIKTPYNYSALNNAYEVAKGVEKQIQEKYGIKIRSSKKQADMEDLGRAIFNETTKHTAAGKERKKNLTPWEKEILSWYDKNVKRRMQVAPATVGERQIIYTITKKLADKLGLEVAQVQQLMFYDNHLVQQLFGRGKAAEDITFADAMMQASSSNFGAMLPSGAAPSDIKAMDDYLRGQLVEKDFGRSPTPVESFGAIELVDATNMSGSAETKIANPSTFHVKPRVGDRVDVRSKMVRSGNDRGNFYLSVGLGASRTNAIVLEDVNFGEEGRGTIIGNVEKFAETKQEIGGIDILNSREITMVNGQWRCGSEVVVSADRVTMVGDLVFAENPLFSESSDIAYLRAEQMEEDVHRYAGDPLFEEEVDRIMSEDGLSREEAQYAAEHIFFSTNIRGTAGRVVESSNFSEDLKKMVAENPANYFEKSSLNDVKEAMDHMTTAQLMEYMRADKLGELKNDENYGPMAMITLINRYHAAGDNEAAAGLVQELAATGTSVGRLLRQFAELKTSSPESMSQVVLSMAEARGKTVDEKTKKYVNEQTRIVFEMHKRAQDLFTRGQQGEDVWDEYQAALKALATAEKDLDIISNKIIERSWGELLRQTVQGNLLTTMSQSTNVVANLANFIPKTMVDVTAYPVEKMLERSFPDWYAKKAGLKRKLGFGSYLYGLQRFGSGFMESLEEIGTGKRSQDLTEWRVSRSMMPLHSIMAFASSDLPASKTKAGEINQRAKLLFQGTFGVPAESMFRLLSLGDTPFRRYAEGLELSQIADARGLEGEERKQFLRFPPNDVLEQARAKGLEFTFQNDTSASQLAEYTLGALASGMGKPFNNIPGFDGEDFFNTIIRMNVPYVRTPANLLEETLTYASPAIAMARVGKHLLEGNPRAASENFAKGMIGQGVTMTSMYLIANGLVSGPPDDDKGLRSLQYDTFPPNCINVSGLRRLMQGGDPSYQAGDEFRNYQKLGLFGSIMGAAASSTNKQAAEEIMNNPFGATELFKRTFGFDNVATLSYMMDQSFLQGLNSSLQVLSISNPDEAERAWSQWVEGMFRSFSAVPLPNQLSAINRTQREYLPDMRSSSMSERLTNTLRDRTFSTGSLPVRYNWKGEPIKQTPEGAGPAAYQLFDVTKKRDGSSDPVSMEALRIYQETGETIKVLDLPYFAQSVFRHIDPPSFNRGKAKKAYEKGKKYQFVEDDVNFKMKLNAEQVNEALRLAASLRYQECSAFVNSDRYGNMTDEERMAEFESINGKYNGLVEFDPNGDFMPHTKYLLDLFEKEYLKRLENGEEFEKN